MSAPDRNRDRAGLLWVLPALGFYACFVLYPLTQTARYSLYDWNGIGEATWVGLRNYLTVLTDSTLRDSVVHALILIVFFTVIPVSISLLAVAAMGRLRTGAFVSAARTVLFLPQIIPLVGAAIVWTWMYSDQGAVNQVLRAVGLSGLARPWLADFGTALPAVGLIGSWVSTGFCFVLLMAGTGKIDPALYEAARLDGANATQEFRHITLPGLRNEIGVAATITTIAALSSFDIVYVATGGGPGFSTMVPGVQVIRLAFTTGEVGLGSALAIVLLVLVLAVVVPMQVFNRRARP
ncbi:carbohydrate ABC transporter permease [Glycomyces artemisiae]|uniref:Carbohydrate ABC transporter membrane protein 1 (CUT1 family) n=1 Tax=Glycomyces artemisiae TaxID=1076443 RepID=A0A2T0UH83_9ACTN|nr:sugar ABC transporter permease [Glycomyces artemisiae]PRY57310.1 carbohydrate ABC transporter membrane protein 1 (CUT1 family) [Glycomyces artemisiae]